MKIEKATQEDHHILTEITKNQKPFEDILSSK